MHWKQNLMSIQQTKGSKTVNYVCTDPPEMRHVVLSTARARLLRIVGLKTNMADALRAAFSSVTTTVFPRSRSVQNYPRRHMINTGWRMYLHEFQACYPPTACFAIQQKLFLTSVISVLTDG